MKPEERQRVLDVVGGIAPEEDLYLIHKAIVKAVAEERERWSELMRVLDRYVPEMVSMPSKTHPYDLYLELKAAYEKVKEDE